MSLGLLTLIGDTTPKNWKSLDTIEVARSRRGFYDECVFYERRKQIKQQWLPYWFIHPARPN